MNIKTLYLKEVDSTNNFLLDYEPENGEDMTVAWTDFQSAGRGCGTNTWESEAGQNLTYSVLLCPKHVDARNQFILSMANAVALKRVLDAYLGNVSIKWPNDIYWRDRKLCGTLIEARLKGQLVRRCVLGTGINVNQLRFLSNAPNPVSLCQVLGHDVDRMEVLRAVTEETARAMLQVENQAWEPLRNDYRSALYRRGEPHLFRLPDGQTKALTLETVSDDGHLLLRESSSGALMSFGFKEIQFIISS